MSNWLRKWAVALGKDPFYFANMDKDIHRMMKVTGNRFHRNVIYASWMKDGIKGEWAELPKDNDLLRRMVETAILIHFPKYIVEDDGKR